MTTPTIGRVVYYRPSNVEITYQGSHSLDQTQPFRADVTFVYPDNSVNLSVADHEGNIQPRVCVPFYETEQPGVDGPYAHWMPYQVAAAAAAAAAVPADPLTPSTPAPTFVP